MTTILALDTATEACSVALLYQQQRTFLNELSPRTHTQRILPMIDQLLSQAGLTLNQIDVLAFGRGPGSFTGVRIGAGIAQGLAFGTNLPVIALSNLQIMAEEAYQNEGATEIVALIDARMNEVYLAQLTRTHTGWQERVAEQVCTPEKAIEEIKTEYSPTVVGTGWGAYSQFADSLFNLTISTVTLPNAKYMLPLAKLALSEHNIQNATEIEPVYLRNEVTWKKLPHKV